MLIYRQTLPSNGWTRKAQQLKTEKQEDLITCSFRVKVRAEECFSRLRMKTISEVQWTVNHTRGGKAAQPVALIVCVCVYWRAAQEVSVSFSICEDGRCVNFCRRLWMCETTGNRRLTFSQIPASHSAQSRTRAPDRCSERLPAAWGYHGDDLDKRQRDKKKSLL